MNHGLAPCPSCGSADVRLIAPSGDAVNGPFTVQCQRHNCYMNGPQLPDQAAAVRLWGELGGGYPEMPCDPDDGSWVGHVGSEDRRSYNAARQRLHSQGKSGTAYWMEAGHA